MKKQILVKLLVNTAYRGPRKEGDVFEVPEDFAQRWVKNKIAEYANPDDVSNNEVPDEVPDAEPPVEEPAEAANQDTADYSNMSAKDLYALCKEKCIDPEPKKNKEYYEGLLNK